MAEKLKALYDSAFHPAEIRALFKVRRVFAPKPETDDQIKFCFEMLGKVSRSFAAVITALGDELRLAVCVFYLVLRALDTIEDDMAIPKEKRMRELLAFADKLSQPGWCYHEAGYGDEKHLLEKFHVVIDVYSGLKPSYQRTIANITAEMAKGMAEFADREVNSNDDYDLYCHYVAGLVGIGLSDMFAASGLEDPSFHDVQDLANSMGLFLQKTNITRDYLEDLVDGRTFWPREIWSKFGPNLAHFKQPQNVLWARSCLNHMVTNALEHVPDALNYMKRLRDPDNFRFCAIPQVMAIATLSKCYNNPAVFCGVVKLRKGLSAKLMISTSSMEDVYREFHKFATVIEDKASAVDPTYTRTVTLTQKIKSICEEECKLNGYSGVVATNAKAQKGRFNNLTLLGVIALVLYFAYKFVYPSAHPSQVDAVMMILIPCMAMASTVTLA